MLLHKIRDLLQIENDNGFSKKEMEEAEKRIGIHIPKILNEFYLQIGKHKNISIQNYIQKPENLKFDENGYLVFYIENQGVFLWAIKKNEIEKNNCKVYRTEGQNIWEEEDNSIEDFLFKAAVLHSIIIKPHRSWKRMITKDEELNARKMFQSPNVIFEHSQFKSEFFLEDSLILMIGSSSGNNRQITITSDDEKKLNYFLNKIGGKEWRKF